MQMVRRRASLRKKQSPFRIFLRVEVICRKSKARENKDPSGGKFGKKGPQPHTFGDALREATFFPLGPNFGDLHPCVRGDWRYPGRVSTLKTWGEVSQAPQPSPMAAPLPPSLTLSNKEGLSGTGSVVSGGKGEIGKRAGKKGRSWVGNNHRPRGKRSPSWLSGPIRAGGIYL